MGNTSTQPNANHPNTRAEVHCKCGAVQLCFRNYDTRMRLECSCFSCRQRHEWSVAQNCPGVKPYTSPTDLTWLDNAETSVKGEDTLRTHILRDGSDTRWLTCIDCSSVLVISNPLYKGNIVAVPRATATLQCHDTMMPCARIQTREWSKRKVGEGYLDETEMPPWSHEGPVLDGRSTMKMIWNLYWNGFLKAMGVAPHREEGDRTVESLMEASGDVVNLQIPEYVHVKC